MEPDDNTGDNGANGDPDGDGLTNEGEYDNNTDPQNPDTDGDGLWDGWEVTYGLEPDDKDTDDDGVNDDAEDLDGDGWTNKEEHDNVTDPTVPEARYLIYDANGGVNAPAQVQAPLSGSYTVALAEPGAMKREGFKFAGWSTNQNGTVTSFAPGEPFTLERISGMAYEGPAADNSNVTLYAVWVAPPVIYLMPPNIRTDSDGVPVDISLRGSVTFAQHEYDVIMEYREQGSGEWITLYADDSVAAGVLPVIEEIIPAEELKPTFVYEVRLTAVNTGEDGLPGSLAGGLYAEATALFLVPNTQVGAEIEGEIVNEDPNNPITVEVTLHEGSTVVAPTLKQVIEPLGTFTYKFLGIPDGRYNVVADNGEYKITESILIENGMSVIVPVIRFAPGKTESRVIVEEGAPKVSVGGLPELFADDSSQYPQADKDFVAEGGTVEIQLLADEAAPADMTALDAMAAAEGQQSVQYVDLSVLKKYHTPEERLWLSERDEYLHDLGNKYLEIFVPLPENLRGRTIDAVYRIHGSLPAEQLPEGVGSGEYFTQDGRYVLLRVNKFSAYAFAMEDRILSVSAGTGGSVIGTPSGAYIAGDFVNVEAVPSPLSIFTGWTVNGVPIDSNVNPASFHMPRGNVTLKANFAPSGFIISAKALTPSLIVPSPSGGVNAINFITGSPGGTVSPSGMISVENGGTRSFAINPAKGYRVFDVKVDGISVGPVNSYIFTDVQADHSIVAWFWPAGAGTVPNILGLELGYGSGSSSGGGSDWTALQTPKSYTIIAEAGPNGSVAPSGTITVQAGESVTIAINPAYGYHVGDVIVDGASIGYSQTYTFENINADHTLEAVFALNTKVPKTGDETDMTLWIMVLINSLMGLLFLFFYRKNRQAAKKERKPDA